MKKEKISYRKTIQMKLDHINNMECPVCKSKLKEKIENKIDNGEYDMYVLDEYFVCLNCGIMYKDIKNI